MSYRTIRFTCPNTGGEIDTEISSSAGSLADNWDKTLRIRCPYCSDIHAIAVRDAFSASIASRPPMDQAS